jgi:hypothetical protein
VKEATWQCRITVKGVRGYVKRTTGEKDFHKAAIVAIKLLGEIEHRIVTDQPLSPSTFKAVAGQFIKAAKTRMDEGRSSEGRYLLIKGTLQRYFLPYFGKRDITMIKKKDLIEYRAWRQAYWISGPGLADKKIFHKVTPSSATLKQEWTVLRGVFNFGVEMSACLRPAMIAKARFNSCSVITFACAIAQIPVSISETLHSADSCGQPKMAGEGRSDRICHPQAQNI